MPLFKHDGQTVRAFEPVAICLDDSFIVSLPEHPAGILASYGHQTERCAFSCALELALRLDWVPDPRTATAQGRMRDAMAGAR